MYVLIQRSILDQKFRGLVRKKSVKVESKAAKFKPKKIKSNPKFFRNYVSILSADNKDLVMFLSVYFRFKIRCKKKVNKTEKAFSLIGCAKSDKSDNAEC